MNDKETVKLLQYHHLLYKNLYSNNFSETARLVIDEHLGSFKPNKVQIILQFFRNLKNGIIPAIARDLQGLTAILLIKKDEGYMTKLKKTKFADYLIAKLQDSQAFTITRSDENKKVTIFDDEKEFLDEFKEKHGLDNDQAFYELLSTTFAFSIWRTLINLSKERVTMTELNECFGVLQQFALLLGILKVSQCKAKVYVEFFPYFFKNEFMEMIEDVI
ncbi:conserved Acidianus plasmid protein [Acidianus hospitalis W1]|uniref:Conserved Acidianus plasmid protein n=1 Tax=Acidianus hospitalis (strain W1) TaxID=933801 RepID=F4B5L1_ACIHW|nr:conserved Acidianus plasmid protein [Acidianus hospitalis W1]